MIAVCDIRDTMQNPRSVHSFVGWRGRQRSSQRLACVFPGRMGLRTGRMPRQQWQLGLRNIDRHCSETKHLNEDEGGEGGW